MSQQYQNDQQPYPDSHQGPQQHQAFPHQQQPPTGPQGPQWGQPGYQAPQGPKKSWVARHKILTGILGVVAFIVIVSVAASGGSDDSKKSDTTAAAPDKPAAKAKTDDRPATEPAPKKDLSQADQFRAFVNKNGTPTEKALVGHVTKVQGADSNNDVLDSADVYTDFSGGMMGPHQADGKLLASAFADWKNSKNGLVTVYDAKGEILSNGNY